jgi:hypothetical protein
MRFHSLSRTLTIVLLASCAVARAEEPSEAARVAQWIAKLQSCDFAEREAAGQALESAGAPALLALEEAARSGDPELRLRAGCLHSVIRRRVESNAALAGKQVRLHVKEASAEAVVAELTRQTGYRVHAVGATAAPTRITLDTGKVSFWQALDRLAAAGWVEGTAEEAEGAAKAASPMDEPTDAPLYLVRGRAQALPTWFGGALRVRALDNRTPGWGQTAGVSAVSCLLEVRAEPSLHLQGPLEVRVTQAIDDADRSLEQSFPEGGAAVAANNYQFQSGVMYFDPSVAAKGSTAPQTVEVRLKVADPPSRHLKELQGVIRGNVVTPPQTLLEIADLAKAGDRLQRGKDDVSVKVVACHRNKSNDSMELHVELTAPPGAEPPSPAMFLNVRQQLLLKNRLLVRRIRMMEEASLPHEIEVVGATGPLKLFHEETENQTTDGATIKQLRKMTFDPGAKDGGPYRLVVRAPRTIPIEAPFTVRQVPLP